MVTEEEARKKLCPMMSTSVRGIDAASFEWINCCASDCMAWRAGVWEHQRNLAPENRTPGVGYCGAFGSETGR